jgi:chromosome segregation ATPase
MESLKEMELAVNGTPPSPQVRMCMLEQMAEALEDQIAALYRRAAAFEQEEFLLYGEIEERQTAINRLRLKLEGLRSDRVGVLNQIEAITTEAAALREEVFRHEEAVVLAAIERSQEGEYLAFNDPDEHDYADLSARHSQFFRRATLDEREA